MIMRLQEKALESLAEESGDISPGEAFAPLRRLGTDPSVSEARLYGRIPFLDQGRTRPLAEPRSRLFYLFHPAALFRDFKESRWKMGFLRLLLKGSRSWQGLYDLCRGLYQILRIKK